MAFAWELTKETIEFHPDEYFWKIFERGYPIRFSMKITTHLEVSGLGRDRHVTETSRCVVIFIGKRIGDPRSNVFQKYSPRLNCPWVASRADYGFTALRRPRIAFSRMIPAICRPFPTPASVRFKTRRAIQYIYSRKPGTTTTLKHMYDGPGL